MRTRKLVQNGSITSCRYRFLRFAARAMKSASGNPSARHRERSRARMSTRARQDRDIQRIEQAHVVFKGPFARDAAVCSARQKAVRQDDRQRREEQQREHGRGRREKPASKRFMTPAAIRRPAATTRARFRRLKRFVQSRQLGNDDLSGRELRIHVHRTAKNVAPSTTAALRIRARSGFCREIVLPRAAHRTVPIQFTAPRKPATNRDFG